MPRDLIRIKPELLKRIMRGKDLWMMRALVLKARLEHSGQESTDVIECKDKSELYRMLTDTTQTGTTGG